LRSLAEQYPGLVTAPALINTGPSASAKIPDPPIARLLTAPLAGRLLWRLKTGKTIRKAASTGFTRPVDIPDAFVPHMQEHAPRPGTVPDAGIGGPELQRIRSTVVASREATTVERSYCCPGSSKTSLL
jgi:hypothetical protein